MGAQQYSNVEAAVIRQLKEGDSPLIKRVKKNNSVVFHNFKKAVEKNFKCKLPCCGKSFPVTIIPGQILYPKYCEEHRTGHRRRHFLDSSASNINCRAKFRRV